MARDPREQRRSWPARLAWMVALWLAGVGTLGAVAWGVRAVMRAVGLAA